MISLIENIMKKEVMIENLIEIKTVMIENLKEEIMFLDQRLIQKIWNKILKSKIKLLNKMRLKNHSYKNYNNSNFQRHKKLEIN